jgi:hypothetical protein
LLFRTQSGDNFAAMEEGWKQQRKKGNNQGSFFFWVCILYRQVGVEGRIYRWSRGGKRGKFKKEGSLKIGKRDLENGSSFQNFEKN